MSVSVFDLFKVGIGPSSSHTVGPMRAARRFATRLVEEGLIDQVTRVRVELFGSLSATGRGHGTDNAVLLGLEGAAPETVDAATVPERAKQIQEGKRLMLAGEHEIAFHPHTDLIFHLKRLDFHPNGMRFTAWHAGDELISTTAYSIGGGFVVTDDGSGSPQLPESDVEVPHPFRTGEDLLEHCRNHRLSIPEVMMRNEMAFGKSEQEVRAQVITLWDAMHECIEAGCENTGVLPGGLGVRRRAGALRRHLEGRERAPVSVLTADPLAAMDWLALWALAVNEENAAGGRVVTAPTNGAAGIVPAVLQYVVRYLSDDEQTIVDFLLTAGAMGAIFQQTASISGAEVGCQGEVGVACAMAAAGLCQVMGGTPQQVTNAAEIGVEHHLGLTCDPVGGLVQVPCIERNAVGAVEAVTAARLALRGDGIQVVSLDQVIRTMMDTGRDMKTKYKETARGGLAVNIIEC